MSLSENINTLEELEYNILEYVRNSVNNMMGGGKSKDSRKILKRKIKKELNDYLMSNKNKIKHKNIKLNKERLEHQIAEIFDNKFNNSYQDMSFIDYFNYYPLVPMHTTTSSKPIVSSSVSTPASVPSSVPSSSLFLPSALPSALGSPASPRRKVPRKVRLPPAPTLTAAPVAASASIDIDGEQSFVTNIESDVEAKRNSLIYKVSKDEVNDIYLRINDSITNAFAGIKKSDPDAAEIATNKASLNALYTQFNNEFSVAQSHDVRINTLLADLQQKYSSSYSTKNATTKTAIEGINQQIKTTRDTLIDGAKTQLPAQINDIDMVRKANVDMRAKLIGEYSKKVKEHNYNFRSQIKDLFENEKQNFIDNNADTDILVNNVDALYNTWSGKLDEIVENYYGPTGVISLDTISDLRAELTNLGYTLPQTGSGYYYQTSDEQTLNNFLSETSAF
jgi:hypothetical protein